MLINILTTLAKDLGIDLNDAGQKADLIDDVNRAAKLYHQQQDHHVFKREMYIIPDKDTNICTLPWFVDRPLYIRNPETGISKERQLWRPRYVNNMWPVKYDNIRLVGESAVVTELYDSGPVTIVLPKVAASDIQIAVGGASENAFSDEEIITIPAGTLKKTGSTSFTELRSFRRITTSVAIDVNIYDLTESKLLAYIPSCMNYSKYTKVQWKESHESRSEDPIWEMMFKHVFVPMVNDSDSYVGTHELDEGLIFLTQALRIVDDTKAETRMNLQRTGESIMANIDKRMESSKDESRLVFEPDAVLLAHQYPRMYMGADDYYCAD